MIDGSCSSRKAIYVDGLRSFGVEVVCEGVYGFLVLRTRGPNNGIGRSLARVLRLRVEFYLLLVGNVFHLTSLLHVVYPIPQLGRETFEGRSNLSVLVRGDLRVGGLDLHLNGNQDRGANGRNVSDNYISNRLIERGRVNKVIVTGRLHLLSAGSRRLRGRLLIIVIIAIITAK